MKITSKLSVLCCAVVAAAAFSSQAYAMKVGISMPTQSLQRWSQDGSNMKAMLEKAGHEVELLYAGDNDIPTQVNQIENMIAGNDDVIVIAPIDGSALTEVLKGAKYKKIPVISYDRLIMNTDAISYYATFDNTKVGRLQGQYIADTLKLQDKGEPLNIEFFTGPTDDNNVNFFWGGAMEVLKPYLDSGRLVCPSGQTTKEQAATLNWNLEEAQKRMENIISSVGYGPDGGTPLAAVLCSNDATANGVTNALLAEGFDNTNMPVITGQDCDKPAVKNIKRGYQSMSVFKDTRTLAAQVVEMVNAIGEGKEVPTNDNSYNNGTGIIPAFLCDPVAATKDNYKELLVDSGYYKESEL